MQTLRHQCDGIIVGGILHGARAWPIRPSGGIGVLDRQISKPFPLVHIAAAKPYRSGRLHIGIMHHRPIDALPVESRKMLYECVGKHHLGIRSALRPACEIARPAIREEAVVILNLQQRLQHAGNPLRSEQRQQGSGRSEGVPDAVEIVIVWRRALPQRILARAVHRHQHRVVKPGGKLLALIRCAAANLHRRQLLVPCGDRSLAGSVKVEPGNLAQCVLLRLLDRDERHPHL